MKLTYNNRLLCQRQHTMTKALRETQTLHAGRSRWPKHFCPAAEPPSRGRRKAKI